VPVEVERRGVDRKGVERPPQQRHAQPGDGPVDQHAGRADAAATPGGSSRASRLVSARLGRSPLNPPVSPSTAWSSAERQSRLDVE